MSRTGRRAGTPGTRDAILRVARRQFAARGYDATSLRAIAAGAKVDPALVIHYFESKERLFIAAMDLPVELMGAFDEVRSLPVDEAATLLVRRYVDLIDGDRSRNAVLALVRSAVSNEKAATMLRQFLSSALLDKIEGLVTQPDAELRGVACRGAARRDRGVAPRGPGARGGEREPRRDRRRRRAGHRAVPRVNRLGGGDRAAVRLSHRRRPSLRRRSSPRRGSRLVRRPPVAFAG